MPDIKEKPKIGQPKEKRQRPGPPGQAGRLIREKFAQGMDQRKELETEDSAYAVDQVEQAGQRGADEFVHSFQQDRRGRRNGNPNVRKGEKDTFSGSPKNSGLEGEAPLGGRPANTPKERRSTGGRVGNTEGSGVHGQAGREAVPVRERPRLAIKERGKEALTCDIPQGQGPAPVSGFPRRPSAGEGRRPRPGEKSTRKADAQLARKLKTGSANVKKRVAAPLGGKEPLSPKVRSAVVKPAAKQPVQAAKQLTQRRIVQQTATQVKRAAKGAADFVRRLTVAVVRAAAAVVGSLVGLVGGGVLLIVLLVVALIAAILNSPFGIFFADGGNAPDAVSSAAAVAQINRELTDRLEELQAGGTYDSVEVQGQPPGWPEVLAVFAARTAGAEEGVDVAVLDPERVELLRTVFWDMTKITTEEKPVEHPASGDTPAWTETILIITITPRTPDDMRVFYQFTNDQNKVLDELLENRELLAALAGDLSISDPDARALLAALPGDLSSERRAVVETACSLVGKVNYFWGGKSLVLGWDERWGTLRQVTAAGSSTTGTYRPYGMDCSGFVDWVFYNITDGQYIIGHGGGAIMQHSYCTEISWDEALPGDLVFYPGDEHVGIVGGRDEKGDLLVIHCASGANNVVISGKSGFVSIAKPVFYQAF